MSTKDLQKELERLQGEKAALVKERDGLKAEQRKLQAESQKSLAGVAVGKLLGQAQSQAQRRVESQALETAIQELNRRIEATAAEIGDVQADIDLALLDDWSAEVRATYEQLAAIADQAAPLALKLDRLGKEYPGKAMRAAGRNWDQSTKMSSYGRRNGVVDLAATASRFAGAVKKRGESVLALCENTAYLRS